jgi:hypothetical protein
LSSLAHVPPIASVTTFSFIVISETSIEFVGVVVFSTVKSSLVRLSIVEESVTSKAVVVLAVVTPLS